MSLLKFIMPDLLQNSSTTLTKIFNCQVLTRSLPDSVQWRQRPFLILCHETYQGFSIFFFFFEKERYFMIFYESLFKNIKFVKNKIKNLNFTKKNIQIGERNERLATKNGRDDSCSHELEQIEQYKELKALALEELAKRAESDTGKHKLRNTYMQLRKVFFFFLIFSW